MITFKCKMCGGELTFEQGASIAECPYCGTKQTLPKLNSGKRANLYDRANHFRRQNEYDKAMAIYEQILQEDRTDAEAYWSLVLCRYGIEYVEDPGTHKRIPTVNRVQYASILADEDYQSALQYADDAQRSIYKAEANAISEIQKAILDVSRHEKPFDVFICYKETDANGRRTPDSVLANDLYHQLTNEGFKVFFSRITLEDKLGSAYEPYIFAALNSAKVMVVLGTKPEYFNAVWVKNEWGRYLALIRAGADKTLVPAYRDMDPYDLPDEFSHLQALDMSKLGFMQDLIRGIKKVIGGTNQEQKAGNSAGTAGSAPGVESLLTRARLFLEDGDWSSAQEYANKVLDIDPKYAEAYIIKVCTTRKVRKEEHLKNGEEPLSRDADYQKAVRFGDSRQKAVYQGYNQAIKDRLEEHRKEEIYADALQYETIHDDEKWFISAAEAFESIAGYKDADEHARICRTKAKKAHKKAQQLAKKRRKQKRMMIAVSAIAVVVLIGVIVMASVYNNVLKPKNIYNEAVAAQNAGQYEEAREIFRSIANYGDSMAQIQKTYYTEGEAKRAVQDWDGAVEAFSLAEDFNDAPAQIVITRYAEGIAKQAAQDWDGATKAFMKAESYKDAAIQAQECRYQEAVSLQGQNSQLEALAAFRKLDKDYKDVGSRLEKLEGLLRGYTARIYCGENNTAGLKSDGTVVAVGWNTKGECDVGEWRDIVAVASGSYHTVGLKSDGTVIADGRNDDSQCDVTDWHDIVAVTAGSNQTVGLKSDGTVLAVGWNIQGQCNVTDWHDIVAVTAGSDHTVGLRSDGTVIAVGQSDKGQCDDTEWHDIVAVAAGWDHTVGLKSDGTVLAVGMNQYGQCNVGDWNLGE